MKRIAFALLFSILFVLTYLNVQSQTLDSRGKDFWITFMPNFHNYKYHSNQLYRYSDSIYIFISAEETTSGTIKYYDINGTPYSKNFTITDPRELYVFKLPFNDYELLGFNDMGQEWKQNMDEVPVKLSFNITTDKYVNVYAHSQGNKSSDAFLVLPTPSLGKEYIVLAYKSDGYFQSANSRTPSQFAIVATEDNTNIDIIPSAPTNVNGYLAQNVTLNKGEVYLVQAKISVDNLLSDLTGTIITANKPIAVFAGHQRATLPVEDFFGSSSSSRDFLCEQLPPIQAWGKSAFIVPFPQPKPITNLGKDIFRVLAANDNTEVYLNNSLIARLNRSEYFEGSLQSAGTITANGPILVAQYKKTSNDGGATYISDPFMMIIPPKEQFIEKCRLVNIQAYEIQDNLQFGKVYQEHYITLVVPQDALTSTYLDNNLISAALFQEIPNSNFYYTHVKVSEGTHFVSSSKPVGVYAYGYGPANSYGYIGGMYLRERDWMPPMLTKDSTYCFKKFLRFEETRDIDSWIDTIYLGENSSNVKMSIESNFKKGNKEVNVEIELIDPYSDGNFEIIVVDSSGNRAILTQEINGFTLKHPAGKPNKYHLLLVNYSSGIPLLVNIPVNNFGRGSVNISEVKISSNVDFRYTGTLPLSIGTKQTDTLSFVLNETPSKYDTIFVKLANECIESEYVAIVFYRSDCDFTEFDFPTFENPTKIIFVGDATKVSNYIQLTPSNINKSGAIWYTDPIPVVSGFHSEFSFRMRNGSNNNCEDGSIPGADGIAFVIQNFIPYAIGTYGGGIGYNGIPNAVVIEFDTFSNDSTQIENFFDPSGNHIAVQSSGQKEVSSKHLKQYTLGATTDIIPLIPDGRIYYSKIDYKEKEKSLLIYLDTTKEFSKPSLVIKDFDLSTLLKLDRGYRAYLGFTAATGCAHETHEILSWYVCPTTPDPARNVDEELNKLDFLIYPNPVYDFAYLNLSLNPIRITIYNELGEPLLQGTKFDDNRIDLRSLPTGIYYLKVITANGTRISKIIKL